MPRSPRGERRRPFGKKGPHAMQAHAYVAIVTILALLTYFIPAAFLAVPLLNLLTPLFAAAMMVHLHKAISARENAPRRASAA